MRFELFVALRYLRSKRKNRFISLITIISIAGVSVGVMTLIIVLGVMTGFNIALRETIIGNRADFTVIDYLSGSITDYPAMIAQVEELCPEILASGPIVQIQALIQNQTGRKVDKVSTGAFILGVDPGMESGVTDLAKNLTGEEGRTYGAGTLPGRKEIVLGYMLANDLGVSVGDRISAYTLKEGKYSPFGKRNDDSLVLKVSGISQAKMSDFDQLFAWVDIETAGLITGREGVDGIHCNIADPFQAEALASRIEKELGLRAITWHENQLAFFEALKQEKLAMFIILVFIVLVAAFNITSTLIMMVMEKQRDIGILRTIGASSRSILLLFMIEGLIIGLSGTFFGVVMGVVLAWNLNPVALLLGRIFGIDVFNSQIYYFDRIPVEVVPSDVITITIAAVILSFLSTLYPAWSASRLDPVDALRYE